MMNGNLSTQTAVDATQIQIQKLETAASNVDKAINTDSNAPRLIDFMNINPQTGPTASGLTDHDYPNLNGVPIASNMTQITAVNSVPLPSEIIDHFRHVQCHCMMGLFPEISRAWLTVDSDIYIWTYEENTDLAYFDGINETILCVGLVKPKPGVFHAFIKYLLVLTTAVDIVVLGVTFTAGPTGDEEEIQLIPDPVFTLPTDGATISVINGTSTGRLFLGSKEGSLYEISYQAESGWFGKRCKKVNLSTSALSFLVPSFINAALSEEDGIIQIAMDNSRHILYTLTEKGNIEVCDLGEKGNSFSRVVKISQNSLVNQAMNTVKTLDSQNFRPIVSISPIEAYESNNLNLIAVSQTGVRFYLTVVSLSNLAPNQRPYTLVLAHVRLPPGYSANVAVRPRAVHMAEHRDRNLVLVSSVKDKDVLWCISSDLFPFTQSLVEAYTTVNLDGPALAMAEVRLDSHIYVNQLHEAPPLVVRQHAEGPKKYVVLTSHSVQIFIKLRPVDLLKQILKESHGHDTEALKTFFLIQREDQACATCLILSSLENKENLEIAEMATRAFFLFGGEPKIMSMNQTGMYHGASMFAPNIISTPAAPHHGMYSPTSPNRQMMSPIQAAQQTFDMSPVQFSARHNGLYLYLSRILRPIWNRRCVECVCLDGKTVTNQSTITTEDCICILNNLIALHNFLTLNTQLSLPSSTSYPQTTTQSNITRVAPTIQDAQMEERQSLDAAKTLVSYCCQIIGLWKILCDHQFHNLIGMLPENQQQILQNVTFKELFLYRHDICGILITTLVNSYLGDNASVDSISNKLMEVCPLLYKSEDAAFSKATEILKAARTLQNNDEKEEKVLSALELCKSIAPNINIGEVCKQFTALKAYKAVIDLCEHCAKKIDPDRIAENFYSTENQADQEGFSYYRKRMEVYKEILNMLDTLCNENIDTQDVSSYNVSAVDNRSILLNGMEPSRANYAMQEVLNEILNRNDEVMHIALYEWMISKQMNSDLIKINSPSLEKFLKHTAEKNPENLSVMDLMWKFYESNNNHAAAAKILNNLASKPGTHATLKERLSYLARAIMCMRSDKVGYAPYLGVFLRDLEDKMEVARVQEQILDAIMCLRGQDSKVEEAIQALNSGLYEISQLYENFAEPFKLLECQLAIIDCAGYTDNLLIESLWQQILANELKKSTGSGTERITQVLMKIKTLARNYAQSKSCFPLDYIVYELEVVSARLKADKNLVPTTLASIEHISFEKLVNTYSSLITLSFNDPFWQLEENEFHLPEATAALINCFVSKQSTFNNEEKRRIISVCQDMVAALLSNLYSKPNSDHCVNLLRGIQAKLSRI